jgi:hypothetical protein
MATAVHGAFKLPVVRTEALGETQSQFTAVGQEVPEPAMGVEPITPALRMRCSAN